jgi:Polyketide cyclase / dehydrase and lipid transport
VLTDYNRLAEFVPDMHVSRIVSKPGEVTHVYQKGDKTWLLLGVPLEMVFRMDETPTSRIRFRLVSGNIKKMFGDWQIVQKGGFTRINYRAHVEPGLLSLRAPGDSLLIESDIENMMNAIGREILKRAAPASSL